MERIRERMAQEVGGYVCNYTRTYYNYRITVQYVIMFTSLNIKCITVFKLHRQSSMIYSTCTVCLLL